MPNRPVMFKALNRPCLLPSLSLQPSCRTTHLKVCPSLYILGRILTLDVGPPDQQGGYYPQVSFRTRIDLEALANFRSSNHSKHTREVITASTGLPEGGTLSSSSLRRSSCTFVRSSPRFHLTSRTQPAGKEGRQQRVVFTVPSRNVLLLLR